MDSFYRPDFQLFTHPGRGTVVETITTSQRGRVRYLSSYWPARLHQETPFTQLTPEQTVVVLGREGMTLLISSHTD
ncbi:MAG: NfeD family protein [Elainellaceae cyanobacterium]